MSASANPDIVEDGLVLCLDAADKKSYGGSGTTWTDRSGNGNNGTLQGSPTFYSTNNGYFGFDGTDDQVVTPVQYDTWHEHSWTVQSWFSYHNANKNNGFFEMTRASAAGNWGVTTVPRRDKFYFYWVSNSNGGGHSFSSSKIVNNNIINVTLVYTAVSGTPTASQLYDATDTYINGQLVSHSSDGGAGISYNGKLYVGSPTYRHEGNMYSFLYYEKALTAAEVLQNYNATKSRFGL